MHSKVCYEITYPFSNFNGYIVEAGEWISNSLPHLIIGYDYPFMWIIIHLGRVTHICVGNLTIIGSDNGLSPGRRKPIIWTNAEILFIGPLGTKFIEIQIGIQEFLYKKMLENVVCVMATILSLPHCVKVTQNQ